MFADRVFYVDTIGLRFLTFALFGITCLIASFPFGQKTKLQRPLDLLNASGCLVAFALFLEHCASYPTFSGYFWENNVGLFRQLTNVWFHFAVLRFTYRFTEFTDSLTR